MKTLYLVLIVLFVSSTIMLASAQVLPVPAFDTAYFKGNNGTYQIPYRLVNGTLTTTLLDLPAKELLFEINATSDGQLTVDLPRTIIDSKSGLEDVPYFVSIYDIRSLGGPIRITPQELNDKDHRIVQVDFTKRTTEIAIAGTWFVENNSTNPSHWNPFGSFSPLQQYNKGIAPKDIQCKIGFALILKREDGSPACIKPDTAQKLVQRGWASEIVSSTQIINLDWGNNTLTLGDVRYDTVSFPPDIKQTIDLDGISFTYTGNGSVTRGDCYGTWVNQTEAKSFSVTADNEFNENPYQCWPPSDYPPQIMENGKPVNILLLRYSFSFFDINQTAGVAWCNSDICPMGKALYLVKYGWNFPVTYDSPSLLQFYFNTNSSVIRIGQAIGIDIGDNNTQPRSIRVPFSYNYSFSSSSLFPCDYGPFRVAAFEGYVTKENLNTTEPLHFYQPGDYTCQAPAPGKFWIFHPMNNTATLVCHLGVYCNDTLSSRHLSFDGYWDDKGHFRLFDNGNYTIVGGDQWGHLAIRHFTVSNSTTAYTTSISQPTTVQTSDVRGTIKDIATSTPLVELASSSTGIELNRGGCCDLYDHDSIKLVLYHGKRSDSHIIAATVENVGKRTVHIYGILISGFVTITNSTAQYHIVMLQDNQDIMPKEDAILQPGEFQTKYIAGNWTMMGKPVNGFTASTWYSYDDLENYNGMTNGYQMSVPDQLIQQ